MNTALLNSLGAVGLFAAVVIILSHIGEFENRALRYICKPFLILFRVCAFVAIVYYEWNMMIMNAIPRWYHIWRDNWWKSKNDPFYTNASCWNSFMNYLTWVFMLPLIVVIIIMSLGAVITLIKKVICGSSKVRSKFCKENFDTAWRFL